MTDLILVRHGEAQYNPGDESGHRDGGLTELGWLQAQRCAEWLVEHYRPDIIVASSLIRCVQSAEVIAQQLGLPVELRTGLGEPSENYWPELPTFPVSTMLPWDSDWRPTLGISPFYLHFQQSVSAEVSDIVSSHDGQTIVIVTHSSTIGTILRSLFGGHLLVVHSDHGAFTHVQWREGHWRLVGHNLQDHLADFRSSPPPVQPSGSTASPLPWTTSKHLQAVILQAQKVASALDQDVSHPDEAQLNALVEFAAPDENDVLLDVGTGTGVVACAFAPSVATAIGIDITPAMLERADRRRLSLAEQNIQFRWAEASVLPFPQHSLDIIVCRDVLSHLAAPAEVLKHFRQFLTGDGKLLIDGVVGSEDPVRRATQDAIECRRDPSFVRAYSHQELESLVLGAGFRIVAAELYDVSEGLVEWLARAAADENTRSAVRSMVEASVEGDAAGMGVRQDRSGKITFALHRLRLLAVVETEPSPSRGEVD